MKTKPATKEAVELFQRGILALSKVESNGIKIDEVYLEKQLKKTAFQIKKLEESLKETDVWKVWKKRFGNKSKLGSKEQLGKVFFGELGYKHSGRKTDAGNNSSDEAAFERVDHPFITDYFKCEKIKKARGTYLLGIKRELCNGRIHPFYDLHIPITFRSSSQAPNLQNFPVRNEVMGKIIRRCVIARDGYQIGEVDLGGAEVAWSCNYNKDPQLIKYIEDSSTDMHRDVGMQLYKLPKEEITKQSRYVAKNGFTFPQFYGSFWFDCANNIWNNMDLLKLTTASKKIPLRKWLKKKGVRELGRVVKTDTGKLSGDPLPGTFQHHVKQVENDFWNNRFKVYKQWKWDWWKKYLDRGWFPFLTGFVGSGLADRKQVCNAPIQGSAFHHLLWSMCELQDEMTRSKMKSRIIMEIHDSMVFELHRKEVDDVLNLANRILTKDAREHWSCIIVPITAEAEVAPLGGSWFDKKGYELK